MHITGIESNREILAELGERIRDARIAMPMTRAELAERSGISARTLANLELGRGATLNNVVSVLRALGLLANVDGLVPEQGARPSDVAKLGKKRVRATSAQKKAVNYGAVSGSWKWGDER